MLRYGRRVSPAGGAVWEASVVVESTREWRSPMRIHRRPLSWAILLGLLLLFDGVLLWRQERYRDETMRLRAGMTELERQRADAILAADAERARLMLELLRRQGQGDAALHLAVNTDSGYLALDRGQARLRQIPIEVGPERRVGTPPDTLRVVVPRGVRTIERLIAPGDTVNLPAWVWADRGLPVPRVRSDTGWVGSLAIMTTGGTLLYTLPSHGPLADSMYVAPGTIRMSLRELRAIRENLRRGTRVYFY